MGGLARRVLVAASVLVCSCAVSCGAEPGAGAPDSGVDAGSDAPTQCSVAPPSTCSHEGTCSALECGQPWSLVDGNGCERPACSSDSDCGLDERCLPSALVKLGCQGSTLESCKPDAKVGCACGFTADCVGFVRCVPKALAPEASDCAFISSSCVVITEQVASMETLLVEVTGASTRIALEKCLITLQGQLASLGC